MMLGLHYRQISILIGLSFVFGLKAASASGEIVLSNLDQPTVAPPNQYIVANSTLVTTSFTTGAAPAMLNSVTVRVRNPSQQTTLYYPKILADNSGLPGSVLETMPTHTFIEPGGSPNYPITLASAGLALAPNTTYWFGMTTDHGGYWYISTAPTRLSTAGWSTFTPSFDHPPGSGYSDTTMYIAIDATILPEPSLLTASVLTLAAANRRRRR